MKQLDLFDSKNIAEEVKTDLLEKLQQLKNHGDREPLQMFSRNVFYALLHKDNKKYRIIDKAIQQVMKYGFTYVLCKVSPEAKQFMEFSRQVAFEKYRATAFVRLKPIDQHKVLYGKFEVKHQTHELIMLHFMERFPTYNIMLVFGQEAYIGRNKEIYKEKIDRKQINLPQEKDEFERYWLTFYKTQYIKERRNLRYLKRMIPKKYWKWVTELGELGLS